MAEILTGRLVFILPIEVFQQQSCTGRPGGRPYRPLACSGVVAKG
jgi:hypothetical protein